jgi:hypothetical protein
VTKAPEATQRRPWTPFCRFWHHLRREDWHLSAGESARQHEAVTRTGSVWAQVIPNDTDRPQCSSSAARGTIAASRKRSKTGGKIALLSSAG